MLHTRWGRATTAAVASLCASAAIAPAALAAPGDLPDLVQQAPTGITMGYFDDHTIGGDNHMGWGFSGSEGEPLAISFQASLRNAGPGVLQLCADGNIQNWRTARQTAPGSVGSCTGAQVNTESLHFRYVTANHSDQTPSTFNRWHVMDLQRFALVPVNAAGGLDTSRRTIWDTQWGTCLADPSSPSFPTGGMACPQSTTANLNVGLPAHAPGVSKLTQEGAPDRAVIAFNDLHHLPTGRYQLVAMANPYGVYRESGNGTGSVACRTVLIETNPELGTIDQQIDDLGLPSNCWVPRTMQSRVTGAGGFDPLQGSVPDNGCDLLAPEETHCWLTVPTGNDDPADPMTPHPLANTNVDDNRATTATNAVAIAQGGTINVPSSGGGTTTPPVVVPQPTTPTTPPSVAPKGPKAIPAMTTSKGRSYVRQVLRRTFDTLPTTASVSCILTGGSTAACDVSWRRAGGVRYRGKVQVWFSSDVQHVRWNYGMSVKRTKPGIRARTTTRSNLLGGVVS